MSKSLIVGDIHLGKGLSIGKPGVGHTLNSRIVDQLNLLDWVVDQAVEEHVSFIVLTGDICEAVKPDYILIELFVSFLKKCHSFNIDVHIIAGNHDLKRTGARYASYLDLIDAFEMPNVHVYKNITTIYHGDVAYTFMPFRDMRSLDCSENTEALDKIEELIKYEVVSIPNRFTKVLVGHLALEGSIYIGDEFDNLSNELMCPTSFFEDYDFTWMGHVHRPQEMEEDPYIAHVGSLDISDFGETDHSKIIISFDSNSYSKFKEIQVPSRPLRYIPIDVPAGFDATTYVSKKIRAVDKQTPLKNAIVKIEIKLLDEDSDGSDREFLKDEAYNHGAYHVLLTESKSVTATKIVNQSLVSSEIKPNAAIEIYADNEEFYYDKEKSDFVFLCKSIVKEHDSK